MRLLKHYESGLPAWAVVLPSYGVFYRCVSFVYPAFFHGCQ